MILKNIIILSHIVSLLMPFMKSLQLCLTSSTNICYPCKRYDSQRDRCDEITYDMKIIIFGSDTLISYDLFKNTGIFIVEEPLKITYYSCLDRKNYFQVARKTYFPLGDHKLHFSKIPLGISNTSSIGAHFQYCLLSYCTVWNNNRFVCDDIHLESLEFYFVGHVSLACVQNITYAYIRSNTVSNISINYFFRNAYNIIYLRLDFENLKFIEPTTFSNLFNLRILRITSSVLESDNQIIFQYNHNLVKIIFNNQFLWNDCKKHLDTAYEHQSFIFVIIIIVTFLFLAILFFGIYYCMSRHESVHSEDIEMYGWQIVENYPF